MFNAVIGALRVNLGIDTAQFYDDLRSVTRNLDRVGKQMQSIGRSMSAYVTAPIAAVGAATVKTAADFEQGMANMAAILRPTQEQFKALRDMAIELAQTTKFTATEAADGMEMLARNGIDATNILGGAAQATLNLASAAGSDLPSAADAMTDVMVSFRKSGTDLEDVVNNIAGTLVNSKMGWQDYVGALGQAAGAAGPLGMSFADMNAMLAATAPSFKSGVEAGTSFKGFLLRLAPSGKQAKDIMAALNLEFFDAAGRMKSAAEIAEELRTKVGHLTKQAQAETMGALFGQRTVRTALRLIEEGAEGIERYKAKIADVSAEEMSKKRLDTLIGSWNLFRAAVESAAIAIGDSGILDWARGIVDAAADVARAVAAANPELLRLATIVAGVVAALGPAVLAAGLFAAAIGAIGLPVAGVIAAVAGLVGVAAAFWDEISLAASVVADAFATAWESIQIAGRMIANVFSDLYTAAKEWLLDKLGPAFKWVSETAGEVSTKLQEISRKLAAVFRDIYTAAKEWLVDKFGSVADRIREVIDSIISSFRWLAEKLGLTALADALKNEVGATVKRLGNDFDTMGKIGARAAKYVADEWKTAAKQISDERILLGGWSTDVAKTKPSDEELRALLRKARPSEEIDLGTYGTGTFDASQYEDAERIRKEIAKASARHRDDLLSEGQRVFEQTRTPAEALRLEFERLNKLVQAGAISWDEYERAVSSAQNEFSGITDAAEAVSQSFGSAIEGMLIDGRNWRDSLAGFLKDIARELLRVAAITPLMNAMKGSILGMFGAAGGGAGAAIGTWATSLTGFANGGAFRVGGAGGIDSQIVAFRASPNESVSITKPGQERAGSAVTVINNNDFRGVDPSMRAWIDSRLEQNRRQSVTEAVAAVAKTRNDNPGYLRGNF